MTSIIRKFAYRALQLASSRKVQTGLVLGSGGAGALAVYYTTSRSAANAGTGQAERPANWSSSLPTRSEQLKALQSKKFDVLIIGGGATGAGCAVDSASRGLVTALVELDDFSSGTSSRSTKLLHGGVRYLEKAIFNLDMEQFRMVREALHERANVLQIAPHLSQPLPIMVPVYKWWQVPYFWAGMKAYDMVAGSKNLRSSYYVNKDKALELYPTLQSENLCGAIVYHDGQHNDARMNLCVALTAARLGATVANHVGVVSLLKKADNQGRLMVCGARVRDEMTGHEMDVEARCVVNATGPFTDSIRQMDDPCVKKICSPSAGVHLVLPQFYGSKNVGLLDPSTSDGRVIFILPWQGSAIVGTTDSPCQVTTSPSPTEEDIQFILREMRKYVNADVQVRRSDVLSAWSGIRPLVSDPNKQDTQSLARNHMVHVSDSGLVTVSGGKWTTYCAMAADTLDAAVRNSAIQQARPSSTDGLLLEGAHGWTPTMYIRLIQQFGLDGKVAQHLANTYGDRAFSLAQLASPTGNNWPVVGKKIHAQFPYIEAEVRYAVRNEYACTVVDIIARRMRIAFLNVKATEEALANIVDIMAHELQWSDQEKSRQYDEAVHFLKTQMKTPAEQEDNHSA